MKRYNSISAQSRKVPGFVTTKPSLTVPNQVFTVREIVDRFRRGVTAGVQTFSSGYNPELPAGLEYLDKIEKIEALRHSRENVKKIRHVLQTRSKFEKEQEASVPPVVPTPQE